MNYFKLLNINISPPEDNEDIIRARIIECRKKWQRDIKNPLLEVEARKNIALVPDIEDIMLNKDKREKHLLLALEEREDIKNILIEELRIVTVKGYIEHSDIDLLYEKYEKEFTKEDILNLSPVSLKKEILISYPSHEKISKLRELMKRKKRDDLSLYDFLEIKMSDTLKVCIQACDKKNNYLIDKPNKEHEDLIDVEIISLAKYDFFSSIEKRKEYDNYIIGNRFEKLNTLIDTGVKANKIIGEELFDALFAVAKSDYDMTKASFKEYMTNNALYNDYEIRIHNGEKKEINIADLKKKTDKKSYSEDSSKLEQMQNIVLPFTEYLSEKINDSKKIVAEVNTLQSQRMQVGFHPSETQLSILVGLGLFFIVFQAVFYAIYPSLKIITILIPYSIDIIFILKGFNDFILWKKLKKHSQSIFDLNEDLIQIYERKLLKHIMKDLHKTNMKKLTGDIETLNSEVNTIINKVSISIEEYNKYHLKLKIPRTGFDYSKELMFILGINIIYAFILVTYNMLIIPT